MPKNKIIRTSASSPFAILSYSSKDIKNENHSHQLSLPLDAPQEPAVNPFKKRRKPQISSIPGTSLKQRDRYRVTVGNQVLGEYLAIDQALELAKRGKR